MRNVLTVAFLLFASPALAETCSFVSEGGSVAKPIDPMEITIISADGTADRCDTFGAGTGIPVRGAACDSGFEGPVFFAPSTMGGEVDLMIFQNTVWYLDGCEG